MHKNEPKQESNQATLARVKKEMDEPRMAESTRERDVNQTTRQKLEKLPQSKVRTSPEPPMRRDFPKEKNNGKADQASS
jgi:hypothetical protein